MFVRLLSILLSIQLLLGQNSFAQDIFLKDSTPDATVSSAVLDSIAPLHGNAFSLFSIDTVPDTPRPPISSKPVSLRSVVIPSAMIAVGAFTLANKDLKKLNLSVRKAVWENSGHQPFHIDDYTMIAPTLAVYGLNLVGIKGKHNLLDRTVLYGMSYLIGSGIVGSVKRLSDVVRPDSSNRLSFPSGHTAQAFIAAEFMRQEYKDVSPWYGVAAYAMAASTGFLRMYNNKHWLNDVIAGAGVGIISTRLSYWLYPKLKNTFFKDKKSSTMVMPTYQNGAVGFGLVHSF